MRKFVNTQEYLANGLHFFITVLNSEGQTRQKQNVKQHIAGQFDIFSQK